MKNLRILIAAAAIIALMNFNWDRAELESRAFVVTIGIDALDNQEESSGNNENGENRFEVYMTIPDVRYIADDKEENVRVFSARGRTISQAVEAVDSKISNRIYFGHTKVIMLGENLLKNQNLLREALDTLERKNDINAKCIILAANQPISEILEAKPYGKSLLGMYISNFYNNSADSAFAMKKMDLETLIADLGNSGDAVIPKISLLDSGDAEKEAKEEEKEGNKGKGEEEKQEKKAKEGKEEDKQEKSDGRKQKELTIAGAAMIADFELAGYAEEDDLSGYLWLGNAFGNSSGNGKNAAGAIAVVEHENFYVSMKVGESRSKFWFEENKESGRLVCVGEIKVTGNIDSYKFLEKDFDQDMLQYFENLFCMSIAEQAASIFGLFRDEYGIDGFNLQEHLKKKNHDLFLKYADSDGAYWDSVFADMDFQPRVTVDLELPPV
ncbi:MAG: hypothetical protein FWD01_03570 [Defluviitaleaceae bacterium]|nr:hypothetical protein [Defluviitaleaceae bacterium]